MLETDVISLGQPNVARKIHEFREALGSMLAFDYGPWETFCTWTFKPKEAQDKRGRVIPDTEIPLSPSTAEREFKRVMKWPCFRSTGWFFVTEPHKDRNVVHVHSLHKAASHITWRMIHAFWLEKYGRFRSDPVTAKKDPGFYLAKNIQWSYLTKTIDDGLWGFSNSCSWIRSPATLKQQMGIETGGSELEDFRIKHTECAL